MLLLWLNKKSESIYSEEYANYLEQCRLDNIRRDNIVAELNTLYPDKEWSKWDFSVPHSRVLISDNEEHVRALSTNYEQYLFAKSNVDMVVERSRLIPTKERIEWINNYIIEKVKEKEEKNIVKNNIEEFEQNIEENNYVDSDSDSDSDAANSSENDVFNDVMTVINNSNSGIYDAEAKKRADFVKNLKFVYCDKETFFFLNETITFWKDSELLIKTGYMTYDDYMLYINKGIDIREKIFEFVKHYLETHDNRLGENFVYELCEHLHSCGFSFVYVQTAVKQFITDFNNRR